MMRRELTLIASLALVACVETPPPSSPAEAPAERSPEDSSIDRYLAWSKECDTGNARSCGLKGDYLTRAQQTLGRGRGDERGAREAYESGCRLGDAPSCNALGSTSTRPVPSTSAPPPANDSGTIDEALATLNPSIPDRCQKYARKLCHDRPPQGVPAVPRCRTVVKATNDTGTKPNAPARCAAMWKNEQHAAP